jgi:hypothetical protein
MNTRTLASRFVVVAMGIGVTASALAQVSPEPTPPPAYDPAQPVAPAPAAPVSDPAAVQAPASPPQAQQAPAYPAPAQQDPAYQAPAQQVPAYPAPAQQVPAYPAPAQTPAYPPPAQVPAYPPPGAQVPAGQMPQAQAPVGAPYGAMPNGINQPLGAPPPSRVRNAFAATLGAILQNAASAGTMGLSNLVTGSITAWFNRKAYRMAGQPYGPGMQTTPGYPTTYPTDPNAAYPTQPAYPTTAQSAYPTTTTQPYGTQSTYPTTTTQPYGTQSAYPTTTTQPYGTQSTYPTTTTQPTTPYPGQQTYTTQGAYPTQPNAAQPGTYTTATTDPYAAGASSYYAPTSYYDPQTGQPTQAISYGTSSGTGTGTTTQDLYAGIAYEVHAVRPGVGDSVPVNPAMYEFRTGDRFLVHYRPSMPGRMEVYNVNPLGQTTLIDSVNMAAGQLSTLGPYEFAATKGDESLRLVLSPCSTPQLLVASRDIINVSNTMQPGMQSGGGLQLNNCSTLTTRSVGKGGVRTRDIRNVALDGGTSFALDPLSRQELTSGSVAPREVTIRFHHR